MNPYLAEFLGTMVLILLGDGVCAATSLEKSKAKGAGWVAVALGWGLAVMCGVFIAGPYSGAHLNPAVTLAVALTGQMPWIEVPGFVLAQLLGGFCGAALVWAFYKDQYDATEDPDVKLGTFCTMPAVPNSLRNFFCEALATALLVFCVLMFGTNANIPSFSLGASGAFPVTMLIVAIGMSLGGATGYAINPARDLAPRIAHAVLPFKSKKRDSDWGYSWIPTLGPLAGGAFAALCYILIFYI